MSKFFKILILIIFSVLIYNSSSFSSDEKIKIGLLVPLTGEDKEIGNQIIKSIRIALKDIDSKKLEIYPRDSGSDPNQTIKAANNLKEIGVQIVIGPVFYKNLNYLENIQDMIFVSLTNQTMNLPNNVISSGVNATSQLILLKNLLN